MSAKEDRLKYNRVASAATYRTDLNPTDELEKWKVLKEPALLGVV